ncbi:hypothetical protein DICPUDRAFT_94442 [Dictyostelium purpureum]|uniref:Uncharacterized protein n=1 Tax=Dictyostelium purpureum TaxID=5786 RepID=F0ZJK0_DICPU|nr:uncharacterized protein DICPUDRAFT_94442 [Dictyostelium purpureum]EGC35860.1 hypothetical protein DICPUDRAFT_94442 [Dictyostelium purpureum]|eukprot:XP_003287591.1 hypothetical protein DICPUDRAFT_94442 [Dictyostelium purpureum]
MGEYIYNIQEKIESPNSSILKEREKVMKNFIGLGPPDLCILTKSYEPPRFVPGLKSNKLSSYHWALGINTESTSAAAVYLGSSILDNQEKSSFGRGVYKIDLCHLISYNAFLKMDLHLELAGTSNHTSPPICYSINPSGEKNALEDLFWKETYISSMLRYIQGPPHFLRPVKVISTCLKNQNDEQEFLKLCQEHFWHGRKLGGYDRELYVDLKTHANPDGMEIDDSNNLLVTTLSDYFISRNRHLPMLNFFEDLYKTEPSVSVPMAIAQRNQGNIEESQRLLEAALEKAPESCSILIELASTLLAKNHKDLLSQLPGIQSPTNTNTITTGTPPTAVVSIQSPQLPQQPNQTLLAALQYVLKALSLRPSLVGAWEVAASVLVQMGYVEWAIVFLSNAPYVNVDSVTDRIGKGRYSKVTPAPENPNILQVLEDEEIEFDEEPGEEVLKCLSSTSLSGDSERYFKILIGLFKKMGWIQLAEKKNKTIDELAAALRNKHKKENGGHSPVQNASSSGVAGGDATHKKSFTKDGHNTISPTSKPQATENLTDNTETDNSTTEPPPPPISQEPNVPKEVLWRDEDVTSDGSDIAEDLEKVDLEEGEGSSTTTIEDHQKQAVEQQQQPEEPAKPKIIRLPFDEKSLTLENISEILSSFIDNYGSESTTPKESKEYLTFDIEPNFMKVKLPLSYINRNLEFAFHALFQDIKAFQSWKEEEEQKKIGENIQISLKHINPNRTISDWTRLGRLAYRLGELGDAEKIFLKLVSEDKLHPLAITGLIKIFTDHGDIRNCLISSSQLSRYYSMKYKTLEMNPIIEKSILNLIAIYGLQKVRNIYATLQDNNNSISSLFFDSVQWRSHGSMN